MTSINSIKCISYRELEQKDSHWHEVLQLARKHGFICQVKDGMVTIATHVTQVEKFGERKYLNIQDQVNAEVFGK